MLKSLTENDIVQSAIRICRFRTCRYGEPMVRHMLATSSCRLCEDGPESSAEPPALGRLCQDGVLTFCCTREITKKHNFFLTFQIEMTSDYQNQCRNSTKLFDIPFNHFSQMLTFVPIAIMKKES